jgi:hypothetical protein
VLTMESESGSLAPAPENALALQWAFGFNHKLCGGVHSLSTEDRFRVFARTHARTHARTRTHTQVSLSILTGRGGVLGSGLELRQPRPSGLHLDRADDPFETRLVRGSSVEFELGFETGVVLWSNPAFLVKIYLPFWSKAGG